MLTLISVLHVLTLNIFGLPNLPFSNLSPYRTQRVAAICDELRTSSKTPEGWDVILIQEAWMEEDRKALRYCGYPYSVDLSDTSRAMDSGLMILSRYPVIPGTVDRHTYSSNGEFSGLFSDGEIWAAKAAIIARIQHPTMGPIWVANTHLVSTYAEAGDDDGPGDRYFENRREQLREYIAWTADKTQGQPLILGGDLNLGPGSVLWNDLEIGLPGFSEAPEADSLCTIDDPADFRISGTCKVDQLFGSFQFEAIKGQTTFNRYVIVDGKATRVSDHLGFETTFRFEPQTKVSLAQNHGQNYIRNHHRYYNRARTIH